MPDSDPEQAYSGLTGAEPEDIPEREARDGIRHVLSLSLSKIADGLVDPKLVLSWLAASLGAPAAVTGLFVPIREAGALLPQMLLAARLRAMRRRKWLWASGAAGQGLAALAIVVAALTLSGTAAGWAICAALAVLAVSRAACSVSYKDVQGRTIAKTRRGAVAGTAASAASVAVLVFAILLLAGVLRDTGPVIAAIAVAGLCWAVSAAVFTRIEEPGAEPAAASIPDFGLFRRDRTFALFVAVRGLLTATALAPPYFVMLDGGAGLSRTLGALVLASAAASLVSSYLWGRFADRSSRLVLVAAGALASAFAVSAVALQAAGWTGPAMLPTVLFGFMVAYHGVRLGRSTYLVDMAPINEKAAYAALANTAIGVLLLVTGAFGGALALAGPMVALAGLAVLSAAGAALALRLPEVQA